MNLSLLKNKSVLIAIGTSLFILILVIVLSPKKNVSPPTTSISDSSQLSGLVPVNLSKEKREQAMIYVSSIENKLPLYLESFKTSVGIVTTINITRLDSDPAEIVYLGISGLSYVNKNELDEKKNPNVTAFKESYLKAMEMLEGQNIDPKKLIFVYGDKDYVRATSQYWIDSLKLRP